MSVPPTIDPCDSCGGALGDGGYLVKTGLYEGDNPYVWLVCSNKCAVERTGYRIKRDREKAER